VDRFVLALGLYQGEDGWQTGQRVPLITADPTLPVLEGNTLIRLGGYEQVRRDRWDVIYQEDSLTTVLLDARFHGHGGEQIALAGVTQPRSQVKPGEPLSFTLHWRANASVALDYTAFVHLLNSTGEKVAQLDWQPNDGISRLPTSSWAADQMVVDTQTLKLPESMTPGTYRLIVGLYHWQDGQRLLAAGDDVEAGDVAMVNYFVVD